MFRLIVYSPEIHSTFQYDRQICKYLPFMVKYSGILDLNCNNNPAAKFIFKIFGQSKGLVGYQTIKFKVNLRL